MKRSNAQNDDHGTHDDEFSSIVHFTNQILVHDKIKDDGQKIFYIPAYLRAKLKNIVEMDFEKLSAKVNIDFILDVYYGELSEDDKKCLEDNMVLVFPRQSPVFLKADSKIVDAKEQRDHCFRFVIRKVIEVEIISDIQWAPFETAEIIITANLRKIKRFVERNAKNNIQQHWVKYKFNFMDVKAEEFHDLKFSLGTETSFGFYNIAEKKMRADYDNKYQKPNSEDFLQDVKKSQSWYKLCFGGSAQSKSESTHSEQDDELINKQVNPQDSINQRQPNKKIDSYQYAYFILPMYKAPYSMAALVTLQLLLIGTVNVCIFYQDMALSGKQMLNMAALMVSLIGILPNIRQSMGRSSQITLAEICTIFQTFTVILTFIHMIQNVSINQSDKENYALGTEGLAIVCLAITLLISLVLLSFYFVHLFVWRKQYHFDDRKYQVMWFERKHWSNANCDHEFRNSDDYQQGKIGMLKPPLSN